jgi:zinc protease
MVEIAKELRSLFSDKPITEEELEKARRQRVLEQAGRWETMGAINGSIGEIVAYNLPDDYYHTYAEKLRALSLADLKKAAETAIRPDRMIWVVVGDREKIEPGIRELNYGEIRYITPDGKLLEAPRTAAGGN